MSVALPEAPDAALLTPARIQHVGALIERGILTPSSFHVEKLVAVRNLPVGANLEELDISHFPEFRQWAEVGALLGVLSRALHFWIGDWLRFGDGTFSDRLEEAVTVTRLDEGTLRNKASVCSRVLPSRRRDDLSFTAHTIVAPLEPREQTEWLGRAAEQGWRSRELKTRLDAIPDVRRRRQPEQPAWSPERRDRKEPAPLDKDRVVSAARGVWKAATRNGSGYVVPEPAFNALAAALGIGGT